MSVRVRVPASSANLGPGFDSLGLALALYNDVSVEEAETLTVSVEGEGAGRISGGERNVVARGIRMALEAVGRPWRGAAVRCVNRIPLARGLGSSAAAWVGGLAAGNALAGSPLDRPALLTLAARAEGHPDNVAAAIYGGLTVSCSDGDAVRAVALPVPAGLTWLALIPEVTSSTAEARAVLPPTVPRADAVFNVQRVALLLASLQAGRIDLLATALEDRLHEPYRLRLFPWMPEVAAAARAAGALGCVLSGAGPTLLAVATGGAEAIGRAMEQALQGAGLTGTARALTVDTGGVVTA
ncbi:MAG: homoserine kinase [Candidatus Rokubacteria bacterium]|nr:homoserine kinase [Candidatus Rokubacteria bacterium]MBI3827150.1 homoserine kinase [Candidatus Rokubacteria bacterium]